MSTTVTLVTVEEFAKFADRPENVDRFFELDEGEIVELSRPQLVHGLVCAVLVQILRNYAARRENLQVCSNDAGVILSRDPGTVRGPDVFVFESEQSLAELMNRTGWLETPPLLVVEVLSPSNTHGEISRKVSQYLASGVRLVWVIDPQGRELTSHRAGTAPDVFGAESEARFPELPDLCVRVAEFFGGLPE
ncbi:Uma2 family endonuclease [Stratiformator vulcanicus]|uniref:Putative restriction endonuclease domain-containing protein n=1 Tax=Stratiformator vulcanicus TaxID=2527980 RepID=A0A517R5P4_9PLAN|nr:Uma2 family endonuclease [Stratiformator vulcanicus]QDT39155.1 hypothetical protein Pan189_35580 [Stratiformator vulcanicus]